MLSGFLNAEKLMDNTMDDGMNACRGCGQGLTMEIYCSDDCDPENQARPAPTPKTVGDAIYRLFGKLEMMKASAAPYESKRRVAAAIVEAYRLYDRLKGTKTRVSIARLIS